MSVAFLKTAAIAAFATSTLVATSAHAQSRYGGAETQTYEDAGAYAAQDCLPVDCVVPGVAPAATTVGEASRYGSTQPVAPAPGAAPVMVDCGVMGNPACAPTVIAQPTTVYTQPQPVYTDSYSTQNYSAQMIDCPAGTVEQADGSCMQSSMAQPTTSYGSSYSSSSNVRMADCPAGTTKQPDGTCMQGSSYSSMSMADSSSMTMLECPTGTVKQADGTCAQSATVYAGDASPSYGYGADGSFGAETYRPIRK